MRIIVLGGTGNFGARIVRALRDEPTVDLLVASRRGGAIPRPGDRPHAPGGPLSADGRPSAPVETVCLDIDQMDFAQRLRALFPGLVIHCAGPFQGQDYRVAKAALDAGAHYLDLADGREFVAQFAPQLHRWAVDAGRAAITGASTLPALSSAVVGELRRGLSSLEAIESIIAPGQRAPRGRATLQSVFGYLGRPFPVWRQEQWARSWGWMDLRAIHLDIGRRLAAACDVPDLVLFPARFAGVRAVSFHAALEFRAQHLALWVLAALRRVGLPLPVSRWAVALSGLAGFFDAAAGDEGGMRVSVVGEGSAGDRVRRTWELRTAAVEGPEIPCMPAILLARRFARGEIPVSGAFACLGFLSLADFAPEFARWGMAWRTAEERL